MCAAAAPLVYNPPPLQQTSCSWVLKESRAVYKAASEGIMNLADKFFEMERAQALQVRYLFGFGGKVVRFGGKSPF